MSFRKPFSISDATFPSHYNNNNNFVSSTNNFIRNPSDSQQINIQNNFMSYNANTFQNTNQPSNSPAFVSPTYNLNKLHQESPSSQFQSNAFNNRPTINNASTPYPNPTNVYSSNLQNSGSQYPNFSTTFLPNQYRNVSVEKNFNKEIGTNFQIKTGNPYFNNDQKNVPNERFSYLNQNFATSNSSVHTGLQNKMNFLPTSNAPYPKISVSLTVNNTIPASGIKDSQAVVPVYSSNPLVIPYTVPNVSQIPLTQWGNTSVLNALPPTLGISASQIFPSNSLINHLTEKESKLSEFLTKIIGTDKKNENKLSIPEYRSALKSTFSLLKLLDERKCRLKTIIESDECEWKIEMQSIKCLQKQLSEMCVLVSSSDHLNIIMNKLKHIKRKRDQKKKTKINKLSERIKAEENRKELHQKIDKWLDDIKEKNLKLKREVEMKKEADFILLEVRKKIQEANRTIEKIKVLEKLRSVRQANAVQKGFHTLPEYNDKFEKKMSTLKETMLRQLADYEAEEKALKVMLETEQEGQLEEKTQWELKRVKALQEKKQNHITDCLFGISEDPLPAEPLYLFHKYHTSANNNIENLVQIRHQWDLYIAEDGEPIPQHWVAPVAPSDSLWEHCLVNSKN